MVLETRPHPKRGRVTSYPQFSPWKPVSVCATALHRVTVSIIPRTRCTKTHLPGEDLALLRTTPSTLALVVVAIISQTRTCLHVILDLADDRHRMFRDTHTPTHTHQSGNGKLDRVVPCYCTVHVSCMQSSIKHMCAENWTVYIYFPACYLPTS